MPKVFNGEEFVQVDSEELKNNRIKYCLFKGGDDNIYWAEREIISSKFNVLSMNIAENDPYMESTALGVLSAFHLEGGKLAQIYEYDSFNSEEKSIVDCESIDLTKVLKYPQDAYPFKKPLDDPESILSVTVEKVDVSVPNVNIKVITKTDPPIEYKEVISSEVFNGTAAKLDFIVDHNGDRHLVWLDKDCNNWGSASSNSKKMEVNGFQLLISQPLLDAIAHQVDNRPFKFPGQDVFFTDYNATADKITCENIRDLASDSEEYFKNIEQIINQSKVNQDYEKFKEDNQSRINEINSNIGYAGSMATDVKVWSTIPGDVPEFKSDLGEPSEYNIPRKTDVVWYPITKFSPEQRSKFKQVHWQGDIILVNEGIDLKSNPPSDGPKIGLAPYEYIIQNETNATDKLGTFDVKLSEVIRTSETSSESTADGVELSSKTTRFVKFEYLDRRGNKQSMEFELDDGAPLDELFADESEDSKLNQMIDQFEAQLVVKGHDKRSMASVIGSKINRRSGSFEDSTEALDNILKKARTDFLNIRKARYGGALTRTPYERLLGIGKHLGSDKSMHAEFEETFGPGQKEALLETYVPVPSYSMDGDDITVDGTRMVKLSDAYKELDRDLRSIKRHYGGLEPDNELLKHLEETVQMYKSLDLLLKDPRYNSEKFMDVIVDTMPQAKAGATVVGMALAGAVVLGGLGFTGYGLFLLGSLAVAATGPAAPFVLCGAVLAAVIATAAYFIYQNNKETIDQALSTCSTALSNFFSDFIDLGQRCCHAAQAAFYSNVLELAPSSKVSEILMSQEDYETFVELDISLVASTLEEDISSRLSSKFEESGLPKEQWGMFIASNIDSFLDETHVYDETLNAKIDSSFGKFSSFKSENTPHILKESLIGRDKYKDRVIEKLKESIGSRIALEKSREMNALNEMGNSDSIDFKDKNSNLPAKEAYHRVGQIYWQQKREQIHDSRIKLAQFLVNNRSKMSREPFEQARTLFRTTGDRAEPQAQLYADMELNFTRKAQWRQIKSGLKENAIAVKESLKGLVPHAPSISSIFGSKAKIGVEPLNAKLRDLYKQLYETILNNVKEDAKEGFKNKHSLENVGGDIRDIVNAKHTLMMDGHSTDLAEGAHDDPVAEAIRVKAKNFDLNLQTGLDGIIGALNKELEQLVTELKLDPAGDPDASTLKEERASEYALLGKYKDILQGKVDLDSLAEDMTKEEAEALIERISNAIAKYDITIAQISPVAGRSDHDVDVDDIAGFVMPGGGPGK